MPLYPEATIRLLPEANSQPLMTPTQVILHSAVDAPGETDLYGWFARADNPLESHFFIQLDGDVIQYIDTNRTADANRTANVRAISIETEDDGNPDQRPWTQAQLNAIMRLGGWLMWKHPGIKRQVCATDSSPGWGYHSMWGAPSPWTPVAGKTCPGVIRITQFRNVIVPWLAGTSTPPLGGFLMALTDAQQTDLYNRIKALCVSGVPYYQDAQAYDGRFQVQTLVKRAVPTAAQIADAVVQALPPSAGGEGVSAGEMSLIVEAAVRKVFADAGTSQA